MATATPQASPPTNAVAWHGTNVRGPLTIAAPCPTTGDVVLSFVRLGKHYGGKSLFEDVSQKLLPGHRYGLVGANGSGKSTLLRMVCGDEETSDGEIQLARGARVGVLRQDRFLDDDEGILDVAMKGDAEACAALASGVDDDIRRTDGYTLSARAGAVLDGLGIPAAVHRQPLATLSGGFKLRVLLAQVLIARPDVLLLDEPTNHLDILSIRWLERFLQGYAGCALIVSHDQRFLENVATDVLDIDYGTVALYPGRFDRFLVEKRARREQKEAAIENTLDAIAHKRAFVERFGAKNTKATQAQSRLKQIEKLEDELDELPPSSRRAPRFAFPIDRPSSKDVLEVKGVAKSYGAKRVLGGVSLRVARGEKVAIVGGNGVGKTTLLKVLAGRLAADGGAVRWGHEAQVGWFAQDHKELLTDANDTPLSYLWRAAGDQGQAWVRGQLGRVLFSKDDVDKSVAALSGGEAARLVLQTLAVQRPNVLLLDEPSNHLDLEAIDALIDALREYQGTVLFVSHDRHVVSALATRVLEVRADGVTDFPGTWSEYLAACGDDHLDATAVALKARTDAGDAGSEAADAFREQKRKKNQRQAAERRRDLVVAELERKEARRAGIRDAWCGEGYHQRTPQDVQRQLEDEERALSQAIDALLAEWERLEAELAEP